MLVFSVVLLLFSVFCSCQKPFYSGWACSLLASPEEEENRERGKRWGGICSRCCLHGGWAWAGENWGLLMQVNTHLLKLPSFSVADQNMHCAQNCSCRHIFLEPGTWHHWNWSQWCFTPHVEDWYHAASALSNFMWWAHWSKHCFGRAHDEGTFVCTCWKIVFAWPNDFMILVLMVRGYQPASQNTFPLFWFAGPWQEGEGFGSVFLLPGKTRALGFFTSVGLFQHQTSRILRSWCR